ncbi:RDD family protein [Saccharicrinis sp. GN24d3]|uniref:RDD family protein n=1 Tax=Saccharicrinis sp. GN24d3 TaxID=3458416 RepID=UPI004034F893
MKSMISDLWFCMAIIMPFFLLFMILFFVIQAFIYPEIEYFPTYLMVMLLPWLVLLFGTLNKDIASGMSAGKRTFGFKVIDNSTKQNASQMQCMLRNMTMLIWPLEAFMILVNPKRRIGDFIANTEVIKTDKLDIETLHQDLILIENISVKLVVTSLIIGIVMTSISMVGTILN